MNINIRRYIFMMLYQHTNISIYVYIICIVQAIFVCGIVPVLIHLVHLLLDK